MKCFRHIPSLLICLSLIIPLLVFAGRNGGLMKRGAQHTELSPLAGLPDLSNGLLSEEQEREEPDLFSGHLTLSLFTRFRNIPAEAGKFRAGFRERPPCRLPVYLRIRSLRL
jgi:hypothetical protein